MEVYLFYLAILAAIAGLFTQYLRKERAARQEALNTEAPDSSEDQNRDGQDDSAEHRLLDSANGGASSESSQALATTFRNKYFAVYTLVLAADWLQGPYIYSIYHEDHKLPENTIAALFGAGFISGGISSSFLGLLADKYGRRNACLGFCVVTTLSCLSVLAKNNLPVLFFGRMLGGLSSTLLYSVFEAWMVTEHNSRNLANTLPLSDMFSWSSTLSGIVAIAAGVIGESLVSYTGSRSSPFLLAILLLILASLAITKYWNENYGQQAVAPRDVEEKPDVHHETASSTSSASDKLRLLVLGLATTIFEGSMYLFVFFWTPTLASARTASTAGGSLPLGLIFSSFMCAMMIGSMLFSHLSNKKESHPAGLLVDVLAVAAAALLIPVLTQGETPTFWAFVLFEMTVGVYYPTMGKLKSELVQDSVRAKVYTWMRLPLNVFVFTALGVTKEGSEYRSRVFNVLGGLLLVTALVVRRILA